MSDATSPLHNPAEDGAADGPPVQPWPGWRWVAVPPALEPATLQRLADVLHGRLDEQRRRQDALSRGQDDLHERLLAQAATIVKLGDKLAWLEPALRDAREKVRFLDATCKTLADRIADLESSRDEP